jgi:prepilin-type N-terminal cleavage/methylation domain-containing protein
MRKAFSLVEVMVAVVIISVVIMAMIKMYADSINILDIFKKQNASEMAVSYFVQSKFGREEDNTNSYNILSEFDVKDELRQRLKEQKINVDYEKVKVIDMSSIDEALGSGVVFEIGRTKIDTNGVVLNLTRFKVE